MTRTLNGLPNPNDFGRVDAALASLGLEIAQAADNGRVKALATSLFSAASQLPTGIELPTTTEHVNGALDAHAMDFLLPGQFEQTGDAIRMREQPRKED